MSYVIAIPTYKRYKLLKEKTLTTLKNGQVSPSLIYIFVANEEESEIYRSELPRNMYREIVVGVKGINEQRKFIMHYFPEKKKIISIDDDVGDVVKIDGTIISNLHEFFINAFKEIIKHKLYIWGIYPCNNPFFMKGQKPITTCLRFIGGFFYGIINRHDMILKSHIEEKEDVENSIKYYLRDGGVLRFNHIGFKTKFKNSNGGLGSIEKRFKANKIAAEYLHATYPNLTRIKIRKNGMYEIVLKAPPKTC